MMITTQLGLLSLFLTISFTVVGGILSYIGLLVGGICPGGIMSGGDYVRGDFVRLPRTLALAEVVSMNIMHIGTCASSNKTKHCTDLCMGWQGQA